MLYPQYGVRIMAIEYVRSLHPTYKEKAVTHSLQFKKSAIDHADTYTVA